jgi:serpin B
MGILDGYNRTSQRDYCPKGTRWTGKRCEGQASKDHKCPFPAQFDGDVCISKPLRPSAQLVMANALMLARHGDLINKNYRTLVREKYRAEIHEGVTVDDVNAWIKRKTDGKIESIIDRLSSDMAAVLLNAVYFKAAWASTFRRAATRPDDFSLSSQRTVRVPMMRQQHAFPLIERPSYRAIRLDYSARALRMIIVLPNDADGLDIVAHELNPRELDDMIAALRTKPNRLVALALPRFKVQFQTGLVRPFVAAGMKLAFSDLADFSGMNNHKRSGERVKISQIMHRAVIEVNEEGTEAAAVTAVSVVKASSMGHREQPKPIPFIVDHPFLFYVIDDATGAILFQGHVRDPLQQ